jgi:hypothetical protein
MKAASCGESQLTFLLRWEERSGVRLLRWREPFNINRTNTYATKSNRSPNRLDSFSKIRPELSVPLAVSATFKNRLQLCVNIVLVATFLNAYVPKYVQSLSFSDVSFLPQ